jgi:hypothetical protein
VPPCAALRAQPIAKVLGQSPVLRPLRFLLSLATSNCWRIIPHQTEPFPSELMFNLKLTRAPPERSGELDGEVFHRSLTSLQQTRT